MEFKKRKPKIFIISGKANSGKDTTCEFIHNYAKLNNLKSVNLQFSSYIKMYAKKISGWDGTEETKPRSLLQELGTDIIRNKIDKEFFVKRIISDIMVYSYYFDVITISDARLPIELDSISSAFENAYKVKIVRPNFENNLSSIERSHITETGLDRYNNYDYEIINSGSLEELNDKIVKILKEVF